MSLSPLSRRDALKTGIAAAATMAFGRAIPAFADHHDKLPLITKAIPSSGEKIPVIGLGTNAYSPSDDEGKQPLREVLDNMHQLGGTLIDTARVYGRSEVVIGELLKDLGKRDKYFIATKTPIRGDYSNPKEVIDVSFKDLQVDTIDLMQIHNLGGQDVLLPEFIKAKEAGRIRYIGSSVWSDDQYEGLMDSMKKYPLDFIQVDYSIANRSAEDSVLKLAQDRNIAVLINIPFGGRGNAGNTFGKVANVELPDWAAEIDCTSWGQVFLKYVVSHPAVTTAIPGTTKLRHLKDNQAACRGRLPDAETRKEIEKFWDSLG